MVDVGKGSARVVWAGHQEVGRGRRPLWGQMSELGSTVQGVTLHFGVSISALLALLCGHTACLCLTPRRSWEASSKQQAASSMRCLQAPVSILPMHLLCTQVLSTLFLYPVPAASSLYIVGAC